MKSIKHLVFIISFFTSAHNASALIFDNGSRRAQVAEAPEKVRWSARAVASVFASSGFIEQESGDYLVKKFQMNSVPNSPKTDALRMLCETELYAREYRAESLKGSGVLITPDRILVPAHLFDRSTDCKDKKIVFNFTGTEDIIPREHVFLCKERESIRYDMIPEFRPQGEDYGKSKLDGHMDYAIIKLDRPVKGIEPPKVNDNPELFKDKDLLYFVSSMRGLPQTVEPAEVKFKSKAVVSTNASTAQGSSGGIYFSEDGTFVGMHISSNPASNIVDNESNCLKWVQESTETFDWETLVFIKQRNVERPLGALMLPTTAFHQKLFNLQKAYYEKQMLLAEEKALKIEGTEAAAESPITPPLEQTISSVTAEPTLDSAEESIDTEETEDEPAVALNAEATTNPSPETSKAAQTSSPLVLKPESLKEETKELKKNSSSNPPPSSMTPQQNPLPKSKTEEITHKQEEHLDDSSHAQTEKQIKANEAAPTAAIEIGTIGTIATPPKANTTPSQSTAKSVNTSTTQSED